MRNIRWTERARTFGAVLMIVVGVALVAVLMFMTLDAPR